MGDGELNNMKVILSRIGMEFEMIRLLSAHHITLTNLSGVESNYRDWFQPRDSITYQNSDDLDIMINSKINYIGLHRCRNVKLNVRQAIAGVELRNCDNVTVTIGSGNISSVVITNSESVELNLPKDNSIRIVRSNKYKVTDA